MWDRLNLQNRKPEGGRDCTEAARATVPRHRYPVVLPNDATPLHNRPVVMKVAVKNDPSAARIHEIQGLKARPRPMRRLSRRRA